MYILTAEAYVCMQMGAGIKRQDPPGMEGLYPTGPPGTSEGDRAIQGAPSQVLATTPGSHTRPTTALTRRPTTARTQTANTPRYGSYLWIA